MTIKPILDKKNLNSDPESDTNSNSNSNIGVKIKKNISVDLNNTNDTHKTNNDTNKNKKIIKEGEFELCPILKDCVCDVHSTLALDWKPNKEYAEKNEFVQVWARIFNLTKTTNLVLNERTVFCAHLKENLPRYKEATSRMHEYGLCVFSVFYNTERPDQKLMKEQLGLECQGAYGVWQSHITISNFIKDNYVFFHTGKNPVLILEDDFDFDFMVTKKDLPFHLQKIANFVHDFMEGKTNKDIDVFYLGHFPHEGYPRKWDLSMWRTWSTMLHSYILFKKGVIKMCEADYLKTKEEWGNETHIDTWTLYNLVAYSCSPQICCQSGAKTSNANNKTNWFWEEAFLWPDVHRKVLKSGGIHMDRFLYFELPLFIFLLLTLFIFFAYKAGQFVKNKLLILLNPKANLFIPKANLVQEIHPINVNSVNVI